jgi:hypothetical protein
MYQEVTFMLAFLKGAGEYIAGSVVGKVIVVAAVGTTVATGGVLVHNQVTQAKPLAAVVSTVSQGSDSIMDSSDTSTQAATSPDASSTPVSPPVDSGVSAINKVTSEGVSKVQAAADSAVSQIQAAQSSSVASLKPQVAYYTIIDPSTGKYVSPGDSNYDKCKSELGGDAGTVPFDQSTAIQAALAKLKAASSSAAASSSSAPQQ